MMQSQYSLCWNSYKSSICGGFSALQQNGEFVDMTLTAEGHFVKVHKVLVALASPYLKELISSAPCDHPIIFLNNVSHKTLCLLLEYIYTGEVLVKADNLKAFGETCKALHIKGLEDIAKNDIVKNNTDLAYNNEEDIKHIGNVKSMSLDVVPETPEQIFIPAAAKNILIKHEKESDKHMKQEKRRLIDSKNIQFDSENLDDTDAPEYGSEEEIHTAMDDVSRLAKHKLSSSSLQYSVSTRGSLQIILNRYIYNLNSKVTRTGVRRWRCVEYRNHKCTAFVVTKGNIVLNRANLHNHGFHDLKILSKIKDKSVFTAPSDIEGYLEEKKLQEEKEANADRDSTIAEESIVL